MEYKQGFADLVKITKPKVKECNVNDIYTMYKKGSLDGILIDVREKNELNNGYIPDSIHISKGVIESKIEELVPDKNQKIYLYCAKGFRSAVVANSLNKMKYKNVISIDGGINDWIKNKYPIIK